MNKDISGLLSEWDYDPSSVTARRIIGEDGNTHVQLRLDLGIFQMHTEGRPDGTRPRGYETIFHYYKTQQTTSKGTFRLDTDACGELQQEAQQFYYRYLAGFKLDDFHAVIRDTSHNLALFNFVARYVDSEEMAWEFLQYKPYVIMMQARARAEIAASKKFYEKASRAILEGLELVWAFWDEQGEPDMKTESYEVEVLSHLLEKFLNEQPHTDVDDLREELHYAVSVENFEKAAELRDRLKAMKSQPV